jgi:sulfite reductase (NADPH) flavoprotein alpha-component
VTVNFAAQRAVPAPRAQDGWDTAPLPPGVVEDARRLVEGLDGAQRLWLSGWLAGSVAAAATPHAHPARPPVTILFGSQSGNAERVARQAAERLERSGVPSTVLDMIDCGKPELLAATTLLVVVSTQGEGDPPDRAIGLWELLNGRKAPSLAHLSFGVLALGDSTYRNFCETGRRFDARLEALGGRRLRPRIDCDVEFDAPAAAWMEDLASCLAEPDAAAAPRSVPASASVSSAWTRRNPFRAPLLGNQRLTASGSSKDVRHIELSLEGSGIRYEPGDALGIVPRNHDADVEALLAALPYDPEAPVELESHTVSLREALLTRADIALVDLARCSPPAQLDAAAFVTGLRPLAPRLYSIASSPHTSPDEAHLTVGVVEYSHEGRLRRGLVSGTLAALDGEGEHLPVYLHRNAGFRLPAPDRPVVMIGAGTGIAPYRAFLAERAALGAPGRNWLLFGDRCFETDFLYQSELLAWRRQGVLTRIDVAFSRDQPEKVYVQQRLVENGARLWDWLQDGACIYVCGDAQRMAPDVHAALLAVVGRHGGLDEEAAAEYLRGLQRERRYQRDVY